MAPARSAAAGRPADISQITAWSERGGEPPADHRPVDRLRVWGAGRSEAAHVFGRPGEAKAAFERARASMAAGGRLTLEQGADFTPLEFTDDRLAIVYEAPTLGRGQRGEQELAARSRIFSDGLVVGHGNRALVRNKQGALEAHHLDLAIAAGHSGQGFGEAYLEHCLSVYRRSGIGSVHLSAGGMVGGYAWARRFEFEGPSTSGGDVRPEPSPQAAAAWSIWEMYGGRERLTIACEDGHAPWGLLSACEDYFTQVRDGLRPAPTPAQLAGIGRAICWQDDGRPIWPGKQIMLGSEWRGVLRV